MLGTVYPMMLFLPLMFLFLKLNWTHALTHQLQSGYCYCYLALQCPALKACPQHVLQPLDYPNLTDWSFMPKNSS